MSFLLNTNRIYLVEWTMNNLVDEEEKKQHLLWLIRKMRTVVFDLLNKEKKHLTHLYHEFPFILSFGVLWSWHMPLLNRSWLFNANFPCIHYKTTHITYYSFSSFHSPLLNLYNIWKSYCRDFPFPIRNESLDFILSETFKWFLSIWSVETIKRNVQCIVLS